MGQAADVDNSRFTLVTSFTSKRNEWLKSECINIFDGKVYRLALEQTAQLDKVIPRIYAHVLYLYTKHPEAKSLAPDGTSCMCDTLKQDILKTGIRKLERNTGVSHHTIDKIMNGERVRRKTLAKIIQRIHAIEE